MPTRKPYPYRKRRPKPSAPPAQFTISGCVPGALDWRITSLSWRTGAIEGRNQRLIAQAVQLAQQRGLDLRDATQAREALRSVFLSHTVRCIPDW